MYAYARHWRWHDYARIPADGLPDAEDTAGIGVDGEVLVTHRTGVKIIDGTVRAIATDSIRRRADYVLPRLCRDWGMAGRLSSDDLPPHRGDSHYSVVGGKAAWASAVTVICPDVSNSRRAGLYGFSQPSFGWRRSTLVSPQQYAAGHAGDDRLRTGVVGNGAPAAVDAHRAAARDGEHCHRRGQPDGHNRQLGLADGERHNGHARGRAQAHSIVTQQAEGLEVAVSETKVAGRGLSTQEMACAWA